MPDDQPKPVERNFREEYCRFEDEVLSPVLEGLPPVFCTSFKAMCLSIMGILHSTPKAQNTEDLIQTAELLQSIVSTAFSLAWDFTNHPEEMNAILERIKEWKAKFVLPQIPA